MDDARKGSADTAGPVTSKGATTRAHIVRAAAEVFARTGYDRARMAELVEATGLTKGAVYFHFDGKEALAVAVLEAQQQAWLASVQERVSMAAPGRARLQALLLAMVELHEDQPATWALSRLTGNLAEIPSARAVAVASTRAWVDAVADLVRGAQAAGEARADVDPTLVATVLVGAFDGMKAAAAVLAASDLDRAAVLRDGGLVLEQMTVGYLTDPDGRPPAGG